MNDIKICINCGTKVKSNCEEIKCPNCNFHIHPFPLFGKETCSYCETIYLNKKRNELLLQENSLC